MDYISDFTYCGNCSKTDGSIYTSNPPPIKCAITGPPQIKCAITGEFHFMNEPCNCRKNEYIHNVAEEYKNSESKTLVVNLFGVPGAGKCFAPGTKVLMYDGTIKNIEDIKVGDQVMGDDSTPRNVLELHAGNSLMYDIFFTSFKETIRVSEGHILTYLRDHHISRKKLRWYTIEDEKIEDFLRESKSVQIRAKAFKKEIKYSTKNLPIDPYYLGLWLGDGLSVSLNRFCTADEEILDYCTKISRDFDICLKQHSYKDGKCQTYSFTNCEPEHLESNPIIQIGNELNLHNNKHIPLIYLVSDRQQRLQLLAGLIDSDGYLYHNYIEIVQKSNQLTQNIIQLCNSLGFNCHSRKIKKAPSNYPDSIGEYNLIAISGPIEEIPVLLERKKSKNHNPNRNHLHSSMQITPVGKGDYYGFSTDGNQRFLLANNIVVHNSSLTAYIFSKLKFAGVNAEMATEFAKDKVWEESVEVFKNQAYIFGKQYFRLSRVKDKVEVIVTDSPILLSPFYNTQPELGYHFDMMCLEVFDSFNNYNAFLKRVKPYNPAGRFQTEEESNELNEPLKNLLARFEIPYLDYDGDFDGADKIIRDVLYILGKKNPYQS